MSKLANDSTYCPRCGGAANGYTTAADTPNAAQPKEGDAAVCAYCRAVNIYRADLSLRPALPAELEAYGLPAVLTPLELERL